MQKLSFRFLMIFLTLVAWAEARDTNRVVVIGAGISGLSAALEAARAGATVTVVEMSTVGGGHAILSNGAVSLVGTPLQEKRNIVDSPVLAQQDFVERGESPQLDWVKTYTENSRTFLYDWLTDLGVVFEGLVRPAGNSVARLHLARAKGWGLVGPLLRRCLETPAIQFYWATRADRLLIRSGTVKGVAVTNLRTRRQREIPADAVIVATGGFQSNLQRVLDNWPVGLPAPQRILLGAAHSATGGGHDLAQSAGGTLTRMDHQWNYVLGLPDPRDPEGKRGLAAFNLNSIWVNAEGKRFTPELGDEKLGLRSLLHQPGGNYWSIFDSKGKTGFSITLAGWENPGEVNHLIYNTGKIVIEADSLEALAAKIGLPAANLRATVERYNRLTETGVDEDFQAFGAKTFPKPRKIDTQPFYAAQFFPITRKSMGGVNVDLQCRVLRSDGTPVLGLYAVGEVTGFGGINGKAALEGTFLGPGVYMGRVAGKTAAVAGVNKSPRLVQGNPLPTPAVVKQFSSSECLRCHAVSQDVEKKRAGYWHYEQSHAKVLARAYGCSECHSDLQPYNKNRHVLDRRGALHQCATCHGVQSREGVPPVIHSFDQLWSR
jgi:predicted oxidoreductase